MTQATIPYAKLSAQGNDFMVVDRPDFGTEHLDHINHWADRSAGVGFDQLLVLNPTSAPEAFDVSIYNADGSQAEQCGNGMRALAHYLMVRHPDLEATHITLHPPAGEVRVNRYERMSEDKQTWVSVSLPAPTDITPWRVDECHPATQAVRVSMGNPHLILVWPTPPSEADCVSFGARFQTHPAFPDGVNVSLAHVGESGIYVRVYERGVGPTLACGSGACATVAALSTLGLNPPNSEVHQPGGRLVIHWQATPDARHTIELAGTVDWIAEGQMPL